MPIALRSFALPLLLAAAPALAQSPFNGTWKGEISSAAVQGKPDTLSLKNGVYSCATCTPPFSVPADGAYHAVKDRPYWDDVSVTMVDDHTVKYSFRKAGKVIAENTGTVSADGMTLSNASRNTNNATGTLVESTGSETRIGAPVAGAHLISGDWKLAPATSVSDAGMTMTIAIEGGMLHLKTGVGETLDAKLGGAYAPNQGDPGKTMTKAEQLGPKTLRLTDMRQGKVVQVSTYTVSDDGRIKGEWKDPRNGDTGTFVAVKQ